MRLGVRGGWGVLMLACSAPTPSRSTPLTELTLLHTSDVHSRLWPFRDRISRFDAERGLGAEGELAEVGGAARLATLLAEERGRGAGLWLDSGDLLEGSPVFGRYGGAVEVELWGALGVAAMALGNHELSLSAEELERRFEAARFPVLAANLHPSRGRWLAPRATVFTNGTPVGVVGCANDDSPPSLDAPHNAWGLSVASTAGSVQAAVDALASHVALVVVLSHLGLEGDHALVRQTTGIDLVLGGHQHVSTSEPQWQEDCATRELQHARGCSPRRVPIVHSGAYGRYLAKVQLRLGAGEVRAATVTHRPVSASIAEDFETAAYLEPYRAPPAPPVAYLPAALGRGAPLGGDSALGNAVTDAVQAVTGADVVLLNTSALRADVEAGPLLPIDLQHAFPFEEPWRLASVTGRELRIGLDRAARRSAARGCESAVQLAGLWWRVHCAACREEHTECWRAGRGATPLADDERLLVALPRYLTLPGADFDALGALGGDVVLSVSHALQSWFAKAQRLRDPRNCVLDLERASPARCADGFGPWCPVVGQRAEQVCEALPFVEGDRDGRIQILP